MQLERDIRIQTNATLRAGMLIRMRYVHHYRGTEFIGIVLGLSATGWDVLVGDTVYHLLYRGKSATPRWKLFNGPALRASSWIHDIDLVYGASDVA